MRRVKLMKISLNGAGMFAHGITIVEITRSRSMVMRMFTFTPTPSKISNPKHLMRVVF